MEANKINLESLSEQEKESGIKRDIYLSQCVVHVSELKGILIFCTVRRIISVVLGHQSTQCLSGFHKIQLKRYFTAFFLYFFSVLKTCKHHSMYFFSFSYLLFHRFH